MTSTPTPAALLPCPFCGSTNAFVQNAGWQANTFIRCRGCKTTFALDNGTPRSHDDSVAAWNRRPSPPPSGDVEARLPTQEYILRAMAENYGDGPHVWDFLDKNACAKAADEIHLLRSELTQERELRKAAEGERDEWQSNFAALERELVGASGLSGITVASELRARIAALEAQLAQLRKNAVEVVKPFAEAADNLDSKDHGDIWESGAAMSINAADLRAARIFLNANDQRTNDGR